MNFNQVLVIESSSFPLLNERYLNRNNTGWTFQVLLPENGIDVDECSEDDMRMAVEALCANLMHTNSLKMLDLSYNTFGDDYGEMILNLLKSRKEQGTSFFAWF